jgi:Fe-S cluster assembly protein SufD
MVNVTQDENYSFVQYRNLIVMGKNSKMSMVQCDDSTNHQVSFSNVVSEYFLDEGANLDHYKLQNLNDSSTLVSAAFFEISENSNMSTNAITLNGGKIRNEAHVKINGRNANADVFGLYLVDKEQHVDNEVFMDHAVADCTSNQLFKGIADDHAHAVFNGQIMVRKDAQRTQAYQNSKNIAITDKATINAKPFLEIYADDVKCSHGATVGQLDDNAMFYIKTRGINEDDARLLLMYAFAAGVIEKIRLQPLKERIDDLVKKRLRGELSVCDQCVLHCSHPEKSYTFEIDMDKL